jgi:copper chaperone CopZ
MEESILNLPSMYGDHHVTEVRRILLDLPGVDAVNASSCFHTVVVRYDHTQLTLAAIQDTLEAAGYSDSPAFPAESGAAAYAANESPAYFRHTTAYAQVGTAVSFGQRVPYAGRPLWPCPGMGAVQPHTYEENVANG